MRIEVLLEDTSGLPVFRKFLGDELKRRSCVHELSLHAHKGKGYLRPEQNGPPPAKRAGLLDLLPYKLRAYQRLPEGMELLLLLVLDSDDDDPDALYQSLESCIRRFCPRYFFVIGIAREEMEAWLLGDWQAIRAAYPSADRKSWESYRQDSICGTWERLASVLEGEGRARQLERLGYPAVGAFKARWAESIAPYLSAERNRSPSLKDFLQRFRRILSLAERKERDGRQLSEAGERDARV